MNKIKKNERILIHIMQISHLLLVLYFFIAAFLAIGGILAKHKLLNDITLVSLLSIFFLQIYYGKKINNKFSFVCPLTFYEFKILKRKYSQKLEYKCFTTRALKKIGISATDSLINYAQHILMLIIIAVYFIY